MLTVHLLYAMHCSGHWDKTVNTTDKVSALMSLYSSGERQSSPNKQMNSVNSYCFVQISKKRPL